jgi:hypothetical protein
MLSTDSKKILLKEIEDQTADIDLKQGVYDKLQRVRQDKFALKQKLLKELSDVNAIISNLDDNLETKENILIHHKQSLKFKKHLISIQFSYYL